MACDFCKNPDLSYYVYERGYEPGINVCIVGDTLHIDSVGVKADGVMHSKDIKINYCPVCGERLGAVGFFVIVRELADAYKNRNTVVCDGEVLEFDRSGKSPWSYDGSTNELDLDKVDISREIEILNNYAREHGNEEDKFDV